MCSVNEVEDLGIDNNHCEAIKNGVSRYPHVKEFSTICFMKSFFILFNGLTIPSIYPFIDKLTQSAYILKHSLHVDKGV